MSRTAIRLAFVPLLLLAVAAPAQLDPALSKAAKKELQVVTKSAAYEHKVQLVDAYINMAMVFSLPLADAQMHNFNAYSIDTMRDALDGWMRDMQAASLNVSWMVSSQIPQIMTSSFGGANLYGRLPLGFRPGDGSVLDDFRGKLASQQAQISKIVDKVMGKVAKFVRKWAGADVVIELIPPEVAWVSGDSDDAMARLPLLAPLDVLLTARGDFGTRVALAGNADESLGQVLVQIVYCSGGIAASQTVWPQSGRWIASFADVTANPVMVRVSRGGVTLVERVIGMP